MAAAYTRSLLLAARAAERRLQKLSVTMTCDNSAHCADHPKGYASRVQVVARARARARARAARARACSRADNHNDHMSFELHCRILDLVPL